MESHDKSKYNRNLLTGTYLVKLDNKKRINIPKQISKSLKILNNNEKKLFFKKEKGMIRGYTMHAINKLVGEIDELPINNEKTLQKMESLGSSLHEITITGDDRISIPDEMLKTLKIKMNSEVLVKGSIFFITISKK